MSLSSPPSPETDDDDDDDEEALPVRAPLRFGDVEWDPDVSRKIQYTPQIL